MNIGVLGLGYVGTVTAACLANQGHYVLGVDIDQTKVESINNGRILFYEPGLEELVCTQVDAKRLQATMKVEDLGICDVVFICVGTPTQNGEANLYALHRALESIKEIRDSEDKIIVIRSTVPPGTCSDIQADSICKIVFVPEFLREGSAIGDFVNPGLAVIGVHDRELIPNRVDHIIKELLFPRTGRCLVCYKEAEMLKYACNAFHALKICFANEIDAIATAHGVNGREVMGLLVQDKKLNSSPAYLRPGFAFGGSCLKKDVSVLKTLAGDEEIDIPLIDNILRSNEEQIRRATEIVDGLKVDKIGIIGLAFKENTDDIRNSAVIRLIGRIQTYISEKIKIYAPGVDFVKLHGTNAAELDLELISMLTNLESLLGWAEVVIITHKVTSVIEEAIYTSTLKIIDLSGHYSTRL